MSRRRGASWTAGPTQAAMAGRDFARRIGPRAGTSPMRAALVVGVLLGALVLVALRIDIIRMRYAVTQALARETELRGQQREFVVESRRLRQPARLAELALELGYERPTQLVRLAPRDDDAPPLADAEEALPPVAAGAGGHP